MALSVVGASSGAGAAGAGSFSLSPPAGVASGDILLAFIDTEAASGACTTPTGWTLIGDKAATAQSMRVTAFRKVAGASEGATTFQGASGANFIAGTEVAIRGQDTTTPVEASSSATTTATTGAVTGFTTTNADMLIYAMMDWAGGETWTVPSGFTARIADTTNGLFLDTMLQSAAGATGTIQGTLSASDTTVQWLIAIAPPAGSGTVSSGVVNMGGSGGLSVPATAQTQPSGVVNMGGSGGIRATGTTIITASATTLGGGPDGIAATGSTAISAGVTTLGSAGGGLSIAGATATLSSGLVQMGSNGGGLSIAGVTLIPPVGIHQSSGVVSMGGSGGMVVTGGVIKRSGIIAMGCRLPAGGLSIPMFDGISEPGGHWVTVAPYTWRGAATPHWVSTPIYMWRHIPSPNVLSVAAAGIETDTSGYTTTTSSLLTDAGCVATLDTTVFAPVGGSTASLKAVCTPTTGSSGVELATGFSIPANTWVTVSLYLNTTGTGGALRLHDYTNGGGPAGLQPTTPTTGWLRVIYNFFQTLATSNMKFCFRTSTNPQTFWIDCVQVELSPTVSAWSLPGTMPLGWKALTS